MNIFKKRDKTDYDWMFDYIINYLRSPLWSQPVQSFIEFNCLIFESTDENKLQYTIIHNQFIELIDTLLQQSLVRIELTEQQFQSALEYGMKHSKISTQLQHYIIDPILAVHDFNKFKSVMCHMNQRLEHEIVNTIKSTNIINKQTSTDNTSKQHNLPSSTKHQHELLQQQYNAALQLSKSEHDAMIRTNQLLHDKEQRELELAIQLSLQSISTTTKSHIDDYTQDDSNNNNTVVSNNTCNNAQLLVDESAVDNVANSNDAPHDTGKAVELQSNKQTTDECKVDDGNGNISESTTLQVKTLNTSASNITSTHNTSCAVTNESNDIDESTTSNGKQHNIVSSIDTTSTYNITPAITPVPATSPAKLSTSTLPVLQRVASKQSSISNTLPKLADITNHNKLSPSTQQSYVDYNIPLSNTYKNKSIVLPAASTNSTISADRIESTDITTITASELDRRKQYMLEQKQKLIALKQQQRQVEFIQFQSQQQPTTTNQMMTHHQSNAASPNTKSINTNNHALKSMVTPPTK